MEKINTYVFDACALIAFLQKETGFEKVSEILKNPENVIFMHAVNFGEVYYDALKTSKEAAELLFEQMKKLPIKIQWNIDRNTLETAGKFKINNRMSLADSYVLALAEINNALVVSTDHHEFDAVEKNSILKFFWLR
jgi:PIN domain nuclease of toxin-antitoxin system